MNKKIICILLSVLMLLTPFFGTASSAYAASKPAAVASFKASATCSTVTLKWKKQKTASGYEIFRSATKNGKYKKVKTVKKNTAKLKIKLGKTYYYKVRAYKKIGKKKKYGKFSSVKKAKAAHAPSTSWTIKKKATCAEQGEKTNVCKYCKKKYSVKTEKDLTTHTYVKELVTGSPIYEDYTKYTCTRCGDSYTTKLKEHSFEAVITAPTCTEQGFTTYKCKKCDFSYVDDFTPVIPHTYKTKSVAPNCTDSGYDIQVCSVCGYIDEGSKVITEPAIGTAHVFEEKTVEPTCTEEGYTAMVCTICGYVDEDTKIVTDALGHEYSKEYVIDEDSFRRYYCTRCDGYKLDSTCYIDIENETVSVAKYASFGKSATNETEINDKLDIYTDENGIVDFEITGTRENFTIDINATGKTEIKLAGISITNNGRDCINVKDKAPDTVDENGVTVHNAPKVYISAKESTENTFITNDLGGNILDCNCPLELRGHGSLRMESYKSTAIDCTAKLIIKNLTLYIKSANRGIDTKETTQVEGIGGVMVEQENYYNIDIEPNANITVVSADDCIRCKNMTVLAITETQSPTVMNLTSTGGDGIQLEGNKGINVLSGNITISAKKYAFNCAENLVVISDNATVNATGATGYSKPAA